MVPAYTRVQDTFQFIQPAGDRSTVPPAWRCGVQPGTHVITVSKAENGHKRTRGSVGFFSPPPFPTYTSQSMPVCTFRAHLPISLRRNSVISRCDVPCGGERRANGGRGYAHDASLHTNTLDTPYSALPAPYPGYRALLERAHGICLAVSLAMFPPERPQTVTNAALPVRSKRVTVFISACMYPT